MKFNHGETITVHPYRPAAARDAHGNRIPGFGPDYAVPGCGVQPATTSEPEQPNRTAVITGYRILAPFDTNVGAHDEVTIRGARYQVEGDPAAGKIHSPFTGWEPGSEFTVKRSTG